LDQPDADPGIGPNPDPTAVRVPGDSGPWVLRHLLASICRHPTNSCEPEGTRRRMPIALRAIS